MNITKSILNNLYEEDHERKSEDYTKASSRFDDIFLGGDYITSDKGLTIVYNIYDEDTYVIKVKDRDDLYFAESRDGYDWYIAINRQIISDMEGSPITVAKYLAALNDKLIGE